MIARALIALCSLAVVGCFFVALAHALRVPDAAVVVIADPAVALHQPWFVRVIGIDPPRRAAFVGTVNGVPVNERGLVSVDRSLALHISGVVGEVALSLDLAVPLAAEPPTSTSSRPPNPATHLLGTQGPLKASLRTLAPGPGEDVVVDVTSSVPFCAELMLRGVTRAMADNTATFRLPGDARPGDLVVVRLADSPLPSARGQTLVAFVKGPVATSQAAPDSLTPSPSQTPVVSPPLEVQQQQRQQRAQGDVQRWRGRQRMLAAALLFFVVGLAVRELRRAPLAALGAVVVVALLLLALDAVLGFVS